VLEENMGRTKSGDILLRERVAELLLAALTERATTENPWIGFEEMKALAQSAFESTAESDVLDKLVNQFLDLHGADIVEAIDDTVKNGDSFTALRNRRDDTFGASPTYQYVRAYVVRYNDLAERAAELRSQLEEVESAKKSLAEEHGCYGPLTTLKAELQTIFGPSVGGRLVLDLNLTHWSDFSGITESQLLEVKNIAKGRLRKIKEILDVRGIVLRSTTS
jgi:hypothetical protein